jgi:hypothetical protein
MLLHATKGVENTATLSIRLSKPVAVLLTVFSVAFGSLLAFFGFVEFWYPDVGPEYAALNTFVTITLMILGAALILVAIATVRGSFVKLPATEK